MKSRRAASTTARSIRTGSSWNRTFGSPIERMTRALQILEAADVVDDRERRDVVEERVDGEVAAERVLFRRAEGVVALDAHAARSPCRPRLGALRPPARSALGDGGFLLRRAELLLRAAADGTSRPRSSSCPNFTCASRKRRPMIQQLRNEPLDLVRVRGRADVEVLRAAAEQQVAHAAADQVRDVVELAQPVEDLQGVRIDVAARDGWSARGMIRGVTIAAHCSKLRPAYPQAPEQVGLSQRLAGCGTIRSMRLVTRSRAWSMIASGRRPPLPWSDRSAARPGAYNQGHFDAAIGAARTALTIPADVDAARLVLGRALLERYREHADARDLEEARDALRAVDPVASDVRRTAVNGCSATASGSS